MLLSVQEVAKHFGPEPVLNGVSFEIRSGQKLALVGPNGAGKTTLLKILAGQEEADRGRIELVSGARLGYLEQQPEVNEQWTVWTAAEDGVRELRDLARQAEALALALAEAQSDQERRTMGDRYDRLHHQLEQRGGYQLDHKIERILTGLGFLPDWFSRPVTQLSGGQQNRLMMARLLLEEPELMLLDEPSNHLDIEATEWLEGFLAGSSSALLVVSHDRYFLDKVTDHTLELFRGTVELYSGNFTAYTRQKQERLEVQRRTYEKQQTEIAKMEDFVRRNHAGQKHAQAEDRRKKLARIVRVEPPREIAVPPMRFPPASRTGDVVLRAERLSKAYDQPLFQELSFDVLRGEKWGILGPNGCGKTTLLRCLLGQVAPDAGRIVWGANVKLAYFDQRLADLDESLPVLEAVRPDAREFPEQQRRDLLARFGLTGDIVHQPVRSLSGGERNRTALARLSATEANMLVLDEPTNHLDLWSRSALEQSLREFDGTVLFVTHDRYFLNAVADHLLVVEPGRFRVIDGNYEEYRYVAQRERQPATDETARGRTSDKAAVEPAHPPAENNRRKRKFPYRKVADLETDIARRESEVEHLHQKLTTPEVLRDGRRVKEVQSALEEVQAALAQLYEHWEEAIELNG